MGDPRLAKMAEPKESPKKQRRSKIAAKITTIVGALLALSVMAAVFVPMLRDHFASLPEDPVEPPITEPIEPPVYPPDDTVPPSPGPDDTPEEEWIQGRLTFNTQAFLLEYESRYGKPPQFDYGVNDTYYSSWSIDPTLEQCIKVFWHHFQLDGEKVVFSNVYRYTRIARAYLIDAALDLRHRTPFDESASVQDTLLVVANAAERLARIACDNGQGSAMIPIAEDMEDRATMAKNVFDGYGIAQDTVWSSYVLPENAQAALDDVSATTARALILLLHGYNYQRSNDTPQTQQDEYMMQLTQQLTADLRELLDSVTIYSQPDGSSYVSVGFSPAKFHQVVQKNLPELIERYTEESYLQFITHATFSHIPEKYRQWQIAARFDPYAEYCVIAPSQEVDFERLTKLLGQLTFEPFTTDITAQADIVFRSYNMFRVTNSKLYEFRPELPVMQDFLPISLLRAGYDESGNYYLQSAGYCARLTDEQYAEFIAICSPKSRNP